MVGRALVNALSYPSAMNRFHPEIYTLVRREPENKNEIYWDPYEMRIDLQKCEGFDAVVHLAGMSIFFILSGTLTLFSNGERHPFCR